MRLEAAPVCIVELPGLFGGTMDTVLGKFSEYLVGQYDICDWFYDIVLIQAVVGIFIHSLENL